MTQGSLTEFPLPLTAYPPAQGSLLTTLSERVAMDPWNLVATVVFALAILHTLNAWRFTKIAHGLQRARKAPSLPAELLHFLGEVEVVFGLWAVVLLGLLTIGRGWSAVTHYANDTVVYTEAIFVVVVMALAATRPIVTTTERMLGYVAGLGGSTPGAWWLSILILAPLLGSLITEPAAMTIGALLLARQFYDLEPSTRFKYFTLGLLFVNVSIGGTLTHFAAPPVLMVARVWNWDTAYMLTAFGWRAVLTILLATGSYYLLFRRELRALARKPAVVDPEYAERDIDNRAPAALLPVPAWLVLVHVLFLAWTVFNSHHAAFFVGGFLIFLGFVKATAAYQWAVDLKAPLLVGFFLAGLLIHGGLQGWWIAPLLASLSEESLFVGATLLTAVNDNALITYLATLVPDLSEPMRQAVVQGAVTGGGLTVIANAPNPAGQALLARFFDNTISPLQLLIGALLPTLLAAAAFRLL